MKICIVENCTNSIPALRQLHNAKTCSPACKRIHQNKLDMERYHKNHKPKKQKYDKFTTVMWQDWLCGK